MAGGGKDSAHALLRVLGNEEYEIVALLTTVNKDSYRSTMHGIPTSLLEKQAKSIGIPLFILDLKPKGTMIDYSSAMDQAARYFKSIGVTHFIFGDIFLHDVRTYRETQLKPLGIEVVEPLWDKSSVRVMDEYLNSGLQTIIVTTMADGLGKNAIGKIIDNDFVNSLEENIDPNGENGEYHTFCYDGPIFKEQIDFRLGEPFTESYDVRLDDGSIKTYTYWFARLEDN